MNDSILSPEALARLKALVEEHKQRFIEVQRDSVKKTEEVERLQREGKIPQLSASLLMTGEFNAFLYYTNKIMPNFFDIFFDAVVKELALAEEVRQKASTEVKSSSIVTI